MMPPSINEKLLKPNSRSVASISLAIANLAANDARLHVVLTKETKVARRLVEEIAYFAPHLSVAYFPDWETLPYDHFSAHIDLVSTRLMTLWQLRQGFVRIVVLTVSTASMRLMPQDYFMGRVWWLEVGQTLNHEKLTTDLIAAGYHLTEQVVMRGEFAKRGDIIDLYPIGANMPYRLDFWDEVIERLSIFDPETQKTIESVKALHLLPAKEYPTDAVSIDNFSKRYLALFGAHHKTDRLYQDVGRAIWPAGMEYYFPLFFERTATFFDYIGANANLIEVEEAFLSIKTWQKELNSFYQVAQSDPDRPVLSPEYLYLTSQEWHHYLTHYPVEALSLTFSSLPSLSRESLAKRSSASSYLPR